jgi:hypothetical protein
MSLGLNETFCKILTKVYKSIARDQNFSVSGPVFKLLFDRFYVMKIAYERFLSSFESYRYTMTCAMQFDPALWGTARNHTYLGEFATKFQNTLEHESGIF